MSTPAHLNPQRIHCVLTMHRDKVVALQVTQVLSGAQSHIGDANNTSKTLKKTFHLCYDLTMIRSMHRWCRNFDKNLRMSSKRVFNLPEFRCSGLAGCAIACGRVSE